MYREWDQDGNLLGEKPIEEVMMGNKILKSARITFIYERIDDGELTIIKELSNNSPTKTVQGYSIFSFMDWMGMTARSM